MYNPPKPPTTMDAAQTNKWNMPSLQQSYASYSALSTVNLSVPAPQASAEKRLSRKPTSNWLAGRSCYLRISGYALRLHWISGPPHSTYFTTPSSFYSTVRAPKCKIRAPLPIFPTRMTQRSARQLRASFSRSLSRCVKESICLRYGHSALRHSSRP